jgi:hypothetical protein
VADVGSDNDWTISGSNMYSAVSGNVGIGITQPAAKLDVGDLARVGNCTWPTTGRGMELAYNPGSHRGYIQVYDRGTSTWGDLFLGNGHVGIGMTPAEALDVNGTIRTTAFEMPTGAGGGKVLTSDGSGVASWQTATGISGVGTTDRVPKFTGATTLSNSPISCTANTVTVEATLNVGNSTTRGGQFVSTLVSDETHAVHGEVLGTGSETEDPIAVYGWCVPSIGHGYGGWFNGGKTGVVGSAHMPGGSRNIGVYAEAVNGNENWGIYAVAAAGGNPYAGYFSGNVTVTGNCYKSGGGFKIDHPLDPANRYLYHSFVESPDMMNVYNGNVTLDANGEAWVELPNWFETINGDFRYQLTAIGEPGPNLYVAEKISGNRFRIAGGAPGAEVSWQVTGIRRDPFAQAHRIPVEVEKQGRERGLYLDPALYGQPETSAIDYEVRHAAQVRR